MGFLDGRLTGRIEWYRKITNNMLTSITLAPSLGFNTYPANLGKIENQGIEFSLSAIPYQDRANQAYWTITVNGSRNKDKLLKISEAMRHMNEVNNANQDDTPLSRYVEGESLNRIWVVRSLGIDPSTGLEIFQKRNGDMTGEYDPVDIVPIGNTEPDWQGFINSSFTYRGWGADVSFQYRFGGQVYNQTLLDKVENASLVYNVDRRVMDLRWQKPGDRWFPVFVRCSSVHLFPMSHFKYGDDQLVVIDVIDDPPDGDAKAVTVVFHQLFDVCVLIEGGRF